MATRAKKTSVKSTKKPTTKKRTTKPSAVKKTASATAGKKTTQKEVGKTKTSGITTSVKTSTVKKELTPLEKIRGMHFFNVIFYVVLAVVSFFAIGKAGAEVLLSYQARDTFTNSESVVLGNASEVLFNLEYRYMLIAALVLGAVGSLLLATRLHKRYEKTLQAGISGYRWIVCGISTAVIVELVSFMAGIQDLMTLKLIAGFVLFGALLGWFSERENNGNSLHRRLAFYGSILAYVLSLLPLLGSFFGTTFYGQERFGWHVYALAGVVALGYISTLLVQKAVLTNKAKYEYVVYEQRYLRIDQAIKFLVVIILLVAIK